MARKGNPWLRFDVQTYSDAKVRLGRCGAVWPWCLATLKRCGGVASDEDLDPMLIAADLSIEPGQAAEQLAGCKRVGLLIADEDGEGWTTPRWSNYQPDPRDRADRRWGKRKATQPVPSVPWEPADVPREPPQVPKSSHATGRDGTGRDNPSPAREAVEPIPADVLAEWRSLVHAGGAPLRAGPQDALMRAWGAHGVDLVCEALAELRDWSNDRQGRRVDHRWLADRCEKIAARASASKPTVAVDVPDSLAALVDAVAEVADGALTPHQRAQVVQAAQGESAEVVDALTARVQSHAGKVRAPGPWVAKVVEAVREAVDADRRTWEAQQARDAKAQAEHEALRRQLAARTPEQIEEASRKLAALAGVE